VTEEEKLKLIISQAQDADQWLNHPVFKHVITLLKAEYVKEFESTKFKERDEREELWRQLQALNRVTGKMERMIRDGANANKTLLQILKEKL
jgi:hypothetical protein